MADVSGPCNTLPGARFPVPEGMMCDEHPDVPAVARVQGETDSFGAEYADLCQLCDDKVKAAMAEWMATPKKCDWCGNLDTDCRSHRDFEEGQAGRVYDVCASCRKKESEALLEEAEEFEREHPSFDYYDDFGATTKRRWRSFQIRGRFSDEQEEQACSV